jgi:signal transduction histidine kinase
VQTLVESLNWIALVLYTAVAAVALWQWRTHGGRAGLWGALAFGALALVVDVGRLLPDDPDTALEHAVGRALVAVLVLFPFFLYRLTTTFERARPALERLVLALTATLVAATFALPSFPEEGDAYPWWFVAYLVAFVVHWTLLAIVVAVRLWRAGRRQPSVARRRMQTLSAASAAITLALVVAAAGPEEGSLGAVATAILSSVAAAAFLIALAPPRALRTVWRRPEQERVQHAIAGLMAATDEQEVAERVLPAAAALVGARSVALRSQDGRVIAEYADAAARDGRSGSGVSVRSEVLRLDVAPGELVVDTSPYAPYFGRDEVALLRTLGALVGLALDRTRLFAQERDARAALERADALKNDFIALAAHELRSPVAVVHGIVETLATHGDELPDDRLHLLRRALLDQSRRLTTLVDQLLDLSRLDAEAVPIEPRQIAVRRRVEELVAAATTNPDDVRVAVGEGLTATLDPNAFDRIVGNLISNALRYGGPPVTVRADQRDRHFRLTVEDRGAGVSPEFVPQLFERFSRSHEAHTAIRGTGLGLAIARSYARAHRGDLFYEQAEPHGACFQLVIPHGGDGDDVSAHRLFRAAGSPAVARTR